MFEKILATREFFGGGVDLSVSNKIVEDPGEIFIPATAPPLLCSVAYGRCN